MNSVVSTYQEKGGQYTKHIYIGNQRIVSKLGDVGSFGVDPRREEYAGENVSGTSVPDYKTKYEALQQVIKDNYQLFEVDYYAIDNDNYVDGEGFCCEPQAQSRNLRSIPTQNVDYEKLQYYYHSDHLGSASYITNLDGEVVQHVEYVPFGEVFIEERNNTWNTPFLFNGKELDEETGLYYYGARYYNPRISLWYGVDPMAEKRPHMSPYNYCSWNPIMKIDPDGMDDIFNKRGKFIRTTKRGNEIRVKSGLFKSNKLTDLNYSKQNMSNRKMLSNVATYYAHKAGFSNNKQVQVNDQPVEGRFASYNKRTGNIGICIDQYGNVNSHANNANNMENSYVHEKAHENNPSTWDSFGETDAILSQVSHSSFANTTEDFKNSIGAYATFNLNETINEIVNQSGSNKKISLQQVQQRVNDLNSSSLGNSMFFNYNNNTKKVDYSIMLQGVDVK